ncbi:hypothetical protein B0J11DRAFT_71239 [Dendryphion nanum]|uniref:Rhodopsin domain-containing protein n=1 Tax=Dendryphion nanum TaxID=256645 RepID=A0A9P9DFW9_9PLEO|nr:hypothetical protein B0J11DRAFT_71239 [Dendryphion nanum]
MASDIPNRAPELLGVNISFLATALVANALRCYVRIRMVKAFGLDDWLMALATLSFTLYTSFSNAGIHYGTGRHHVDLTKENIRKATNRWWYCYMFYCVSMITSKLSIGWFLLRIAIKRIHSWIIYSAMAMSFIAGTVFFFVTMFQCNPISYFWDTDTQDGKCINIEIVIGLGYLYSAFSIISDFTFALLPAFLVWNLQLNRRTKMVLIPLLTMGCIASSAVVARVPYFQNLRNKDDFLWGTVDIAIWSTVEQGLAITAGSLATLRPLFSLILHRFGFNTGPSRQRPSNYGPQSPSASHILGSRRKPSQDLLDRYNLSTLTETACVKNSVILEVPEEAGRSPPSPSWFGRSKRASESQKKARGDNESEKSLQSRSSKESASRDPMHIVVSKTFAISNDKKR